MEKRILKGTVTIFIFSLLSAPAGYLIRILYSHTLSIENFGLFYSVFALINFFTLYNDLGFGSSLAYFTPKFRKKKDYLNLWNSYKYSQVVTLILSTVISIFLFFLAPWLSINYFRIPAATNLIYILIIFFITNGFITITTNFFVGLEKEIYYSSKEFIRLFFTLIFSIIFWFYDVPNVIFYALAWSTAHVVTSIIFYYLLYKKNFHLITPLHWDRRLFEKLMKYAFPSILVTSIYSIITSVDIFFLTLFRGVAYVGIYNIILPIASIPTFLLLPFSSLFIPLTSRSMEGKKENVVKIVNSLLIYIPFIVFYFSLFVILFPSPSIEFLFGKKWLQLADDSLQLLSLGMIFSNLSYYLSIISLGMGFVKERLKISIAIACINLVLSGFLIYKFGILGAAMAYGIVYLISIYMYSSAISSKIPIKYPWSVYLKLICFGTLIYFMIYRFQIKINGRIEFFFAGVIYTLFMALFAHFMGLFNKKMVKLLFTK